MSVGCRICAAGGEADNGNLQGFRESRFIFPAGVAKEKEKKKKILKLSLKLHIFRFYN